ncbi:MAG: glycosyltransferase family 39 protein [Candidatus Roizmanbacteria bacterium]|nr:glycosyltransferase family 39 protein [Candidatus Roizmanbacteria bacterium]
MLSVLTLGFILRLLFLNHYPFFTDEAIYTYWARSIYDGSLSPFIPLFDGKTVLFVWATSALIALHVPVMLAGRIVSALSFLGTGYFVYHIAKRLIPGRERLALLLYALNPFALFFERMAIMDPLMTTGMMASIYYCIELLHAHKQRAWYAASTGILLALAFLTKPTAQILFFFMAALIPLLLVKKKITLIESLIVLLPTIGIFLLMATSSGYDAYRHKNMEFVYSLDTHYLILLRNGMTNYARLGSELLWFMSPLIGIPLIMGIWSAFKKKSYELIAVSVLVVGSYIGLCMIGKVIFSRHLFFLIPLISLLMAAGLTVMYPFKKLLLYLLFGYFIINNTLLILDTPNAFLGTQDRDHYVTGTASGYGIIESAAYVKKEIGTQPALVIPLQNFGNFPYTYDFILADSPNIMVVGAWKKEEAEGLMKQYPGRHTYLLFNHSDAEKPANGKTFWRPGTQSGITVLGL